MTDPSDPNADDYGTRLRQAGDPATPPEVLADLAYNHPELRPLIAANPAAYEGLLEWMAALGEPAVTAALAARGHAALGARTGAPSLRPMPTGPSAETALVLAEPVSAAPPPAKRRTGRVVGVVAGGVVVALLLAGGGVFAVNTFLTGGGPTESAKAFPASTYNWSEVAIDPSAGQKLAAVQLLSDLPGLKDLVDDDGPDIDYENPDLKSSLWDYIIDNESLSIDTSLDYEDDIKPWLGSRVAYGLIADAESPASVLDAAILAIEASDTKAGITAVSQFLEDIEAQDIQVTSHNGYVIVASAALDLNAAYAGGDLSASPEFTASTSKIGGWGLAASWTSPVRAAEANLRWLEESDASGGMSLEDYEEWALSDVESWQQEVADYNATCPRNATFQSSYCRTYSAPTSESFYENYGYYPDAWEEEAQRNYDVSVDEFESYREQEVASATALIDMLQPGGSVASSVRLTDNALEFVTVTSGLGLSDIPDPKHSTALSELSDTTMAAASVSQLGTIIDNGYSAENAAIAVASGSTTGSLGYIDSFPDGVEDSRDYWEQGMQDAFGISVPDELIALLGTNTLIAVDADFACAVGEATYTDGACSDPGVAALVYADDAGDTADTIGDLLDSFDPSYGLGLDVAEGDDKVVVSRGSYGDTLLEGASSTLGSVPRFTQAVPELSGSFASAYVDVAAVLEEVRDQVRQYSSSSTEQLDYLEGIDSIGFTASKAGAGDVSLRFRVVVGSE